MKTIFRNYNNFNASIFDLMGGKKEIKQTISLGFLLANDTTVLSDFLKLKAVVKVFGKTSITNYDKIVVHTELISQTGKRADIVIKFFRNNKPDKALLIEAKSIRLNVSPKKIVNQIESYLSHDEFPSLNRFTTYGCILTKSSLVFNRAKVFSVSWNFVIKILTNKEGLAKDYLNFLTKINGVMKFYEEEVCSIPAGKSHSLQSEYPYIYECPNEGKNYTSLKKPLYFTFRNGDGEMERLYGLDEIIVFNPKQDFDIFMLNSQFSDDIKERVKAYCNKVWGEGAYSDKEKQFFILSTTNTIELKHKPKPPKNNTFRAYYRLSDLLDSSKGFVEKK